MSPSRVRPTRASLSPRGNSSLHPAPTNLSRRHIRTAINNAWEKLDKYYALTDETPVYLAALVLHPGQEWRYFEQKWAERPDWLEDAKMKMKAFYQGHWERRPVP